jgi:hypothetical protein
MPVRLQKWKKQKKSGIGKKMFDRTDGKKQQAFWGRTFDCVLQYCLRVELPARHPVNCSTEKTGKVEAMLSNLLVLFCTVLFIEISSLLTSGSMSVGM